MADNHPQSPTNMPEQGKITATAAVAQPKQKPGEAVPQARSREEALVHGTRAGASRTIRPENLPLTMRTSSRTVTFSRPFMLSGLDRIQPAGTYTVETDEELIQELSFPAYRRTATLIILPSQPGSVILAEIATIDPLELEVALERDAMQGLP
jgi:hypothetical protein